MLIELVLVAALLMYLNAKGIIDFESPNATGISIGIIIAVLVVAWAVWFFVARRVVDGLFGFSSWAPKKPTGALSARIAGEMPEERFEALEKLVREVPRDIEVSRQYADQLLKRGRIEDFVEERLRILQVGKLNALEKCSIYNRLADIELQRKHADKALMYLNEIAKSCPDTVEGANARKRMELVEKIRAAMDGDPNA
jgi:hypothetical protein